MKTINMNQKPSNWAWMAILIAACIVILASCTTTKKNTSVTRSSVDSSSVTRIDSNSAVKVDSTVVKKDNTVTTVESEDNYTKETVIEFDTAKGIEFDTFKSSSDPADYFTENKLPVNFTKQRVSKITIKETGVKKEKSSKRNDILDSTAVSKTQTAAITKTVATDLHKTETVKTKDVKRTSYWGWLWIALIVAAAVYVCWRFGVFKWFVALFKRKDKST